MDGKTDNLRLNDGQKTRLLNLGFEPDRPAVVPDGNEQRGDLLCDILRRPLPIEPPAHDPPSLVLRSVAGPPLRELLLDPATDIALLRRIKEYAKSLGNKAGTEVEKDVFLAIYFAAIAAALTYHSKRITEHSDHDLKRFFGTFARASWIPQHLAELFSKAGC